MPTLFTRIIRGEIPCHKIYEDTDFFAFLDIRPIHGGHTLLVPKLEVDHYMELPSPQAEKYFPLAQNISRAIQKVTGSPRMGMAFVGFEIPHCHMHIVPLWTVTDLDFRLAKPAKQEDLTQMRDSIVTKLAYLSVVF